MRTHTHTHTQSEELDEKANAVLPPGLLAKFEDAKWKERLEACEKLREVIVIFLLFLVLCLLEFVPSLANLVAQWLEHRPGKLAIRGSIPVQDGSAFFFEIGWLS